MTERLRAAPPETSLAVRTRLVEALEFRLSNDPGVARSKPNFANSICDDVLTDQDVQLGDDPLVPFIGHRRHEQLSINELVAVAVILRQIGEPNRPPRESSDARSTPIGPA